MYYTNSINDYNLIIFHFLLEENFTNMNIIFNNIPFVPVLIFLYLILNCICFLNIFKILMSN